MTKFLLIFLYTCGLYLNIAAEPATYLPDGLTFRQATELYYQTYPEFTYGHVTRFGSDWLALDELYRSAQEFKSQYARGYGLLGGGYGYHLIGGKWYLVDSRASEGYRLRADGKAVRHTKLTEAQSNLLSLSELRYGDFIAVVNTIYHGIISVKSPNDIGREFCLINLDQGTIVGPVIAGGVAARSDWLYYGPSVNDYYGHLRIGQRVSRRGDTEFYWLADLSDSAWGNGMHNAALLPIDYCFCE